MKRNTFGVIFFIREKRMKKDGSCPIFCQITVNGTETEILTQNSVSPEMWDKKKGEVKKKHPRANSINSSLTNLRKQISDIHAELYNSLKTYNAKTVKQMLQEGRNPKMLIPTYEEHLKIYRAKVGKEYCEATIERYERVLRYLTEYIQKEYRLEDIALRDIDYNFIDGFALFIKIERNAAHNYTMKLLQCFKSVIISAHNRGWIERNPFFNYRLSIEKTNPEYLEPEELQILINKAIPDERLNKIRDIFVFCCFTGLAYIDVYQLRPNHIHKDAQGQKWIRKDRQKTKVTSQILLFDVPEAIIERYRDNPGCIRRGTLLPVPTNQKMNAYLKEIAAICGIEKNLTTHLARHTFATTALTLGVSLESVSSSLGHDDLESTFHYAQAALETNPIRRMEFREIMKRCGATEAEFMRTVIRHDLKLSSKFPRFKLSRGNQSPIFRQVYFGKKRYDELVSERFLAYFLLK